MVLPLRFDLSPLSAVMYRLVRLAASVTTMLPRSGRAGEPDMLMIGVHKVWRSKCEEVGSW